MPAITAVERKTQGENVVTQSFPVLNMSCAACAVSVESSLKAAEGVEKASVNFANQSALVSYDTRKLKPSSLQQIVRNTGYDLVIDTEDPEAIREAADRKNIRALKIRTTGSVILSVPVMIFGMFFSQLPFSNWISMALTIPVVFYFGRNFFIHAWKQARLGRANMDTLVALSTGIAFLFSAFNTIFPQFWLARGIPPHAYYEAAAVVIAFISLGKYLEEKAKSKTSSAIKILMGLQPKTVRIVTNGEEKDISITSVSAGQIIRVRPGERIPVDGVVTSGSSFVDESTISGEPLPAEKKAGTKVFAGTMNRKGSFEFEAVKVGSETILAQIIKTVQQAQGSKAPVQRLVDKIAGIFVPVVIAISVLTFIIWMTAGGDSAFTHALLASVTVLVIACPCALGLATPTAMMVGIGKGATHHILVKDAYSLERAHRVEAVILDKTGTITEGKPLVTGITWEKGLEEKVFASILYSLEVRSEHPLAEAVVKELQKGGDPENVHVENYESLTARGVTAEVNNQSYFAGNRKLIEEKNIRISKQLEAGAEQLQNQGGTLIYFANAKQVLAVLAVSDKIKDSSAVAIRELQEKGIEVYMLTGDDAQTAKAVATRVGIKNFLAEALPSDKASFIRELQQQQKVVAMVGDGINDAEALAQADVSIAMGKGSDVAMDVAHITLITSDLRSIPKALKLSGLTVKGIRQNLFWAFIYNLIGIPLAAGVLYPVNGFLLNPMIAGAAMALSSISVVANSLRLKSVKL